jgi:hypothetical protein
MIKYLAEMENVRYKKFLQLRYIHCSASFPCCRILFVRQTQISCPANLPNLYLLDLLSPSLIRSLNTLAFAMSRPKIQANQHTYTHGESDFMWKVLYQ